MYALQLEINAREDRNYMKTFNIAQCVTVLIGLIWWIELKECIV